MTTNDKGFTLWLDRESWGIVTDALIEHRTSATNRKAENLASTSDIRADMCAEIISKINLEGA